MARQGRLSDSVSGIGAWHLTLSRRETIRPRTLALALAGAGAASPRLDRPDSSQRRLRSVSGLLVVLALLAVVLTSFATTLPRPTARAGAATPMHSAAQASPLSPGVVSGFEANVGQGPAGAQFVGSVGGYSLSLTPTTLAMARAAATSSIAGPSLRMHLLGASASATGSGQGVQSGSVNYLIGNDPSKWHTGIATYSQVVFHSVYPGIDVVYHSRQDQLEYDFVVAPGANPGVIRLGFDDASTPMLDSSGALVLPTAAAPVRFAAPNVYQNLSAGRQSVTGQFALDTGGRVSFSIGAYDRSRALVIDPTLAYSTYVGGSGDDAGNSIAVDTAGNQYITGFTRSANFPVTTGAYQTTQPFTGGRDAFVSKFTIGGALVYSTFLGGQSNESWGVGIAVDSSGEAVVTGGTYATDFPTTPGVFQPSPVSFFTWGFLTKLNAAGSSLVFSTYVGDEVGNGTPYSSAVSDLGSHIGVTLDSAGNAYIVASTQGADWPTTPGAFAKGSTPFSSSGVAVAKFDPLGRVLFSTMIGPGWSRSIAVDTSGNAYITGEAFEAGFPVTPGAYKTQQGFHDGFLTKVNPTGTGLVYSTFLGQRIGVDDGDTGGVAIDSSGDAYVASGGAIATTPGAFDTGPGGGFVAEFNPSGSALVYSTYVDAAFPGIGLDARAIALDPLGNAYIAGNGNGHAFVTEIAAGGASDVFATTLGGSGVDTAKAIATTEEGVVAVTGATTSSDFPILNAAQSANGGGPDDAFLTAYELPDLVRLTQGAAPTGVLGGQTIAYTMNVVNDGSVGDAAAVTLSDPLPASVGYVSSVASQGSCSQSGGTVTCPLGAMPANTAATVTIQVTAPNTGIRLVNTASIAVTPTDPDPFDNAASAVVDVNAADVSIAMTATPAPVVVSTKQLMYKMTVTDAGPLATTGVKVVDPVPSGASFTSATASQGSCTQSGGTVACALGSLANGATATVQEVVTVTAPGGSTVANTATVSADQFDPDLTNNSSQASVSVNGLGCGEVIVTNTKFTSDLGPCLFDGLVVGADHITINLNGHQILGTNAHLDDFAGIRVPVRNNVTIENGSISGFADGTYVNSGGFNTITNMNIHDNIGPSGSQQPDFGDGIFIAHSMSNRILNNVLNHNGSYDNIAMDGLDTNFNLIQGNTIVNAGGSDLTADGKGIDIAAFLELGDPRRGNSIYGNTVIANTITGNTGAGISNQSNVNGQYIGNDIERNGAATFPGASPGNGIGIGGDLTATPFEDALVEGNRVIGNGGDGIQVLNKGNRILDNTSEGNGVTGNPVQQTVFDLADGNGNCTENTWTGNTYSLTSAANTGGVNPACLASTNDGVAVAAASRSAASPTPATQTPQPRTFHGRSEANAPPLGSGKHGAGKEPSVPATPQTSSSSNSPPACGETITSNFTLTANLGPCAGPGLIINADNITVNLNGHSLVGPGPTDGTNPGIEIVGHTGDTVENGSVSNFDIGVLVNMSASNTITRLNIHDDLGPDPDPNLISAGIDVFHSAGNTIVNNVLTHDGITGGIQVLGVDSNANIIKSNSVTGTVLDFNSTYDLIAGINVMPFPNDNRAIPLDGNDVVSNTVTGSQGSGITVVEDLHALLRANTVGSNGIGVPGLSDGIGVFYDSFDGLNPNTADTILGNTATGNGDNGINIQSVSNTIQGNTTGGNNANHDGSFDLNDQNPCGNNVWKGNTSGSAGVNEPCV